MFLASRQQIISHHNRHRLAFHICLEYGVALTCSLLASEQYIKYELNESEEIVSAYMYNQVSSLSLRCILSALRQLNRNLYLEDFEGFSERDVCGTIHGALLSDPGGHVDHRINPSIKPTSRAADQFGGSARYYIYQPDGNKNVTTVFCVKIIGFCCQKFITILVDNCGL